MVVRGEVLHAGLAIFLVIRTVLLAPSEVVEHGRYIYVVVLCAVDVLQHGVGTFLSHGLLDDVSAVHGIKAVDERGVGHVVGFHVKPVVTLGIGFELGLVRIHHADEVFRSAVFKGVL